MLKRNSCSWVLEFRLHPVLSQMFVTGYVGESMSVVGRVKERLPGGEWKLLLCVCVCVCVCACEEEGREGETAWMAILLYYYPSCREVIRHEGHR